MPAPYNGFLTTINSTRVTSASMQRAEVYRTKKCPHGYQDWTTIWLGLAESKPVKFEPGQHFRCCDFCSQILFCYTYSLLEFSNWDLARWRGTRIMAPEKATGRHGPLARYVKLWVAHAPGMPGTFPTPPRVSDPVMHHGTCVTHVPWFMSGSLTIVFLLK